MQQIATYNFRSICKSFLGFLCAAELFCMPNANAQSNEQNLPPRTITAVCIDQDKPPCITATRYLREGTNAYKIELAYPVTARGTNSDNIPYYDLTNAMLPPSNGLAAGTNLWAPQGAGVVLPPTTRLRGPRQLISVEKLPPIPATPLLPQTISPVIAITSPKETTTSSPLMELMGVCNEPLKSIRFDVINSIGQFHNQQGFVTDSYFDTAQWRPTTNYFECTDIDLATGTNIIVLRCEDYGGHLIVTNFVYVLRLDQDKTPPAVSVQWPLPGKELSGESFSMRGQIDDVSARVIGRISANGLSKTVEGVVERNGRFWVENLPLLGKTNVLTLVVTDAAGNSAITNMPVIRSDNVLTIDPVPTAQLWQLQVKVTGKIYPTDQKVWLNGRPAVVDSNGTWTATGVPLNKEGVAIFEAVSVPAPVVSTFSLANTNTSAVTVPQDSVSINTAFTSSEITLNTSMPTYGTFQLHLTGTASRSFIISASTNLIDWTPVLTNRNSGSTFDYADTNVMDYGCRFFRVTPIN